MDTHIYIYIYIYIYTYNYPPVNNHTRKEFTPENRKKMNHSVIFHYYLLHD